MGKFRRSAPAPKTADEFVAAADRVAADRVAAVKVEANGSGDADVNTDTGIDVTAAPAVTESRPWDRYRKKATAKNIFNLRLNDYYLTILRHLAAQDEDRSMQAIVKEILLPELERLAVASAQVSSES